MRRWRRVWSDFGASHQKRCKENEKGRDESLKIEGPNRKRRRQRGRGGLAEKRLETLNAGKSEAKNENNPKRMLQIVNG